VTLACSDQRQQHADHYLDTGCRHLQQFTSISMLNLMKS